MAIKINPRQLCRTCLILLLAIFCTSCEKDVPLGTLSASVDGNERIFDSDPKAEWTSDPEGYDLWIHGIGVFNEISIRISSQTLITARSYQNTEITFYRILLFIPIEYYTASGYVNISEIDGTHVQGTFSGTLRDSEGTTLVISKGVFNLSI
ncbi:MAG: hypothetical protein IH592_06310 [Bacteroidales bacterium]|nr:hypothetical protein [Bacteroidales bacterium]